MKYRRYALKLCYDGTNYSGWQIQPNARSIQQELQGKLTAVLKQPTYVIGSGRTDAGVHALGQVAHFDCVDNLDTQDLFYHLNVMLDPQIKLLDLVEVPMDFHARFSAIGKRYTYYINIGPFPSPFHRNFSWYIKNSLEPTLLEKALKLFEGTHDFSSFAHKATQGSASVNPIRTIDHIAMVQESSLIAITFSGNGFLHKMIRNIMGACISVGLHKHTLEEIEALFALKDRRKAPKTAPAKGLFLESVHYPIEVFPIENALCLKPSMSYSIV